jgi:predicted acyl esterase
VGVRPDQWSPAVAVGPEGGGAPWVELGEVEPRADSVWQLDSVMGARREGEGPLLVGGWHDVSVNRAEQRQAGKRDGESNKEANSALALMGV